MDTGTRSFMESRFGTSIGDVRVHTGSEAASLSHELGAHAFTLGSDIYFGQGQYRPDTDSGKHILAHELAHVAQQSNVIHPYRKEGLPKSIHHGDGDDARFSEDKEGFDKKKDIETKPWIEKIIVYLMPAKDKNGVDYWKGAAVAKYYDNPAKLDELYFAVSAGSAELGMTSSGTYKVKRLEGHGYMSSSYSDPYPRESETGWGRRYTKLNNANMHYAVFFHGAQALHYGYLTESSHGCVHVDVEPIRQVNYHSVVGLTKVQVIYSK
jgi:hypothetical protein